MQNNFDHKFRPRGIEKWHAFAALVSGDEQKDAATEEKILSFAYFDEYYDDLDFLIKEAYQSKKEVKITYLQDNQYHEMIGIITKIDDFQALLFVNNQAIQFKHIYSVSYT